MGLTGRGEIPNGNEHIQLSLAVLAHAHAINAGRIFFPGWGLVPRSAAKSRSPCHITWYLISVFTQLLGETMLLTVLNVQTSWDTQTVAIFIRAWDWKVWEGEGGYSGHWACNRR